MALFSAQCAVGILVLELFNYIAHYGLVRRAGDGRREPFSAAHSWNSSNVLANALIFNMGRHAHHHARPFAPYQTLQQDSQAPELPWGYAGSILLALVPPLWHRVMDQAGKVCTLGRATHPPRFSLRMSSTVRIWIGFTAMCVGMSMAVLDIQIVASSFTTIQEYFHVTADQLSWIQTAYLMAEVIAIPLTGWLTRAVSLRWMFAAATLGFTIASLACALCDTLPLLIGLRVVQGFCGGMLIPGVFTSVFSMMPERHRVPATALAGTLAVIAPTIGPAIGGYLTEHYTWHWIFLINLVPGTIVSGLVAGFVRLGAPDLKEFRRIDYRAIGLAAVFLATLELVLKEAPKHDWQGLFVYACIGLCAVTGTGAIWRSLYKPHPFVDLSRFRERTFTLGCVLSFVLGLGLYGSVYLLALFLGLIREHSPLEIGKIMIVSGAAQLVTAPIAAWLETRDDAAASHRRRLRPVRRRTAFQRI